MSLGFTLHTAGDVRWKVTYRGGTDYVYATSEAIAIQRYTAKYPKKIILKVERA